MILKKEFLTKASKKGRTTAVATLNELARLGGLPDPIYQHEASAHKSKLPHFYSVRFRVPAFLKKDYFIEDTVFGAGRASTKQFAKSLAALETIHRLEERLDVQRDGFRKNIEKYALEQKEAKETLENLPIEATIPNVSWATVPIDSSLSAATPATREGRISFLSDTGGCPKAMLIAKAMTLTSQGSQLPEVVLHANQTDEGIPQRFANINSMSDLVMSANGALGEASYGADYRTCVRMALQSVYINMVSGRSNATQIFAKESTRLKKDKLAHKKRYRDSPKHMAKIPTTNVSFQGLLDSIPYSTHAHNIPQWETRTLFDYIAKRPDSSFGMAKLVVRWPPHQQKQLEEVVKKIKPQDELWCHSNTTAPCTSLSVTASEPLYFETKRKERIATFREHQKKISLPIDDLEKSVPTRLQEESDVTILCGGTGSGKTTRYPLMVSLFSASPQAGKDTRLRMVVAQPRRLACQAAAKRVAEEQGYTEMGGDSDCPIGYSIRFDSRPSSPRQDRTVDFQTIGVVLATAASDPLLSHITHLVLDEVHERNADMDLLLALAKNVQKQRLKHETLSPLRIILMSATIDSKGWESYFNDDGDVRVTKVSVPDATRYPIDIIHLGEKGFPRLKQASAALRRSDASLWAAAAELISVMIRNGKLKDSGSILCFLPGIEEIRTVERMIKQNLSKMRSRLRPSIIILHSSISTREQNLIFKPGPKCILSTNIAETSITIPDVKIVVDPGRERQSAKLEDNALSERATVVGSQLVTVDIAQSSAKQRAGRTGRVAPGTVFRLYSQADLQNRPSFTKPEILRMDLAQLVLRSVSLCGDPRFGMKPLDLISGTPDPPKAEDLHKAVTLLMEYGLIAFDETLMLFDEEVDNKQDADGSDKDETIGLDSDRERDHDAVFQKNHCLQLTHVGKAVSTIPATPRIGRMLLLGLTLRALEPALSLAALLSVPKVFSDYKKNKKTESNQDESCSDLVQKLDMFVEYKAMNDEAKKSVPERKEFDQVLKVRRQLEGIISDIIGIDITDKRQGKVNPEWNKNENRVGAQAALVCFVSQNVASLVDGRANFATRDCPGTAKIHPSSVNFSHNRRSHWYVYNELRKTSQPFMHITTAVSPMEVALFSNGGTLSLLGYEMEMLKEDLGWTYVADHWIPVRVAGKKRTADTFLRLKEILNYHMLNDLAKNPPTHLENADYKLVVDIVMSAIEQQRRGDEGSQELSFFS